MAAGKPLGILSAVSFGLAAVVLGVWVALGASFVTQYQVAETVVETDEFGDEIERTEMVDQFQFGLLPDRGYDGAAPIAGFFVVLGAGLGFLAFRRKKAES